MKFTWLIKLIGSLFATILPQMSGEIKEELNSFLLDLLDKAEKTPNVFDDMAIELLCQILGIDTSKKIIK